MYFINILPTLTVYLVKAKIDGEPKLSDYRELFVLFYRDNGGEE